MLVPLKVVIPVTVTGNAGVAVAEPDIVKFPTTVVVDPGIVFMPLVLSIRWPYVSAVTVCAVPE